MPSSHSACVTYAGVANLKERVAADAAQTARQHERDANALRERLEELEPMLTETQQERFQLQRQSEQQRQERSELLLRVFKDVNRFLGNDVGPVLSISTPRSLTHRLCHAVSILSVCTTTSLYTTC